MANILAIDDDRDLCTLLKTALERDGHTVETRTSGTQLTDTLCRWADCILLDVMMPGRLPPHSRRDGRADSVSDGPHR